MDTEDRLALSPEVAKSPSFVSVGKWSFHIPGDLQEPTNDDLIIFSRLVMSEHLHTELQITFLYFLYHI